MPTLVWIRRPESGVAAARGEYGAGSRSGEAAVPDPFVSAASAVPGPVVSSSDVALRAVLLKQHANGGKKKKCEINHAKSAAAAKKRSRATSDRDLPQGVYKTSSGKFQARIQLGGKTYYIGTFDTPEQASAAYVSVKKEIDDDKLSELGADEVDALFDAAQKKSVKSFGGFVPEKRDLPTGVRKLPYGFEARLGWGGKSRRIGTFDTPDKASAAYASVKKVRDDAKQSGFGADEVNVAFDAAKKKALEASSRAVSKRRDSSLAFEAATATMFTQNCDESTS